MTNLTPMGRARNFYAWKSRSGGGKKKGTALSKFHAFRISISNTTLEVSVWCCGLWSCPIFGWAFSFFSMSFDVISQGGVRTLFSFEASCSRQNLSTSPPPIMDRDRFEGLQTSFHECSIHQIMMLIVMLVDEVQWRIREFRWQEIAPENSETGNQTPPAVAVGQNQVEDDGSTASGSDPENPPAARRGPVQPSGPPPNWTPAPWKRFRRGGWTLLADLLIPSDVYQFLLKKNPSTSTPSQGLSSLCQIYLTCNWWGNWLLVGRRTTYLHISMPPDFQTGWWCYHYMLEPMILDEERCLHNPSLQPDFQTGFFRSRYEARWCFPNLLHSGVLRIYFMISAARFSDELGMQTGDAHPYIWYTYTSVRPGLQTGHFLEPLRGRVMVFRYAMVHYIQLHDHCSPIFRQYWNTALV